MVIDAIKSAGPKRPDEANVEKSNCKENQANSGADREWERRDPMAPSDCSKEEDSSGRGSGNRREEERTPRRSGQWESAPPGERKRKALDGPQHEEPRTKAPLRCLPAHQTCSSHYATDLVAQMDVGPDRPSSHD